MKLSLGYLEEIALKLKQGGILEGKPGRNGGYRLIKNPKSITIEAVLSALEGPMALVPCQTENFSCPVESACASKNLWHGLRKNVLSTLRRTTVADLV